MVVHQDADNDVSHDAGRGYGWNEAAWTGSYGGLSIGIPIPVPNSSSKEKHGLYDSEGCENGSKRELQPRHT